MSRFIFREALFFSFSPPFSLWNFSKDVSGAGTSALLAACSGLLHTTHHFGAHRQGRAEIVAPAKTNAAWALSTRSTVTRPKRAICAWIAWIFALRKWLPSHSNPTLLWKNQPISRGVFFLGHWPWESPCPLQFAQQVGMNLPTTRCAHLESMMRSVSSTSAYVAALVLKFVPTMLCKHPS